MSSQALLCSSFIPFFSGIIPPSFRGVVSLLLNCPPSSCLQGPSHRRPGACPQMQSLCLLASQTEAPQLAPFWAAWAARPLSGRINRLAIWKVSGFSYLQLSAPDRSPLVRLNSRVLPRLFLACGRALFLALQSLRPALALPLPFLGKGLWAEAADRAWIWFHPTNMCCDRLLSPGRDGETQGVLCFLKVLDQMPGDARPLAASF